MKRGSGKDYPIRNIGLHEELKLFANVILDMQVLLRGTTDFQKNNKPLIEIILKFK